VNWHSWGLRVMNQDLAGPFVACPPTAASTLLLLYNFSISARRLPGAHASSPHAQLHLGRVVWCLHLLSHQRVRSAVVPCRGCAWYARRFSEHVLMQSSAPVSCILPTAAAVHAQSRCTQLPIPRGNHDPCSICTVAMPVTEPHLKQKQHGDSVGLFKLRDNPSWRHFEKLDKVSPFPRDLTLSIDRSPFLLLPAAWH
jgi:hypothetical protein